MEVRDVEGEYEKAHNYTIQVWGCLHSHCITCSPFHDALKCTHWMTETKTNFPTFKLLSICHVKNAVRIIKILRTSMLFIHFRFLSSSSVSAASLLSFAVPTNENWLDDLVALLLLVKMNCQCRTTPIQYIFQLSKCKWKHYINIMGILRITYFSGSPTSPSVLVWP